MVVMLPSLGINRYEITAHSCKIVLLFLDSPSDLPCFTLFVVSYSDIREAPLSFSIYITFNFQKKYHKITE